MTSNTTTPKDFAYRYAWDRQGRKGQPCRVLVRSRSMNSCLVVFADGYTMITSRNAIRKLAPIARPLS